MKFDPSSIDEILGNVDLLDKEQPIENNPLHSEGNIDTTVNIDKVYDRLNSLVDAGNRILEASQYLVETTPEADNITSAATLLTSMKDVLKEFRLIHDGKVKREHEKDIELLKQQGRKDLIELKTEKLLELKNDNGNNSVKAIETIPFSQEDVVSKILHQENESQPQLIEANIVED